MVGFNKIGTPHRHTLALSSSQKGFGLWNFGICSESTGCLEWRAGFLSTFYIFSRIVASKRWKNPLSSRRHPGSASRVGKMGCCQTKSKAMVCSELEWKCVYPLCLTLSAENVFQGGKYRLEGVDEELPEPWVLFLQNTPPAPYINAVDDVVACSDHHFTIMSRRSSNLVSGQKLACKKSLDGWILAVRRRRRPRKKSHQKICFCLLRWREMWRQYKHYWAQESAWTVKGKRTTLHCIIPRAMDIR